MTLDVRARLLLGVGVAAGLALALAGLLVPDAGMTPPGGVAAIVNGIPIAQADLQRALDAEAADRQDPAPPGEADRVLDRLIDEELLLQHALALGLARSDPRIRGELVRGVVDAVDAESDAEVPTDAQLQAFYAANASYFARSGRRRVARYYVRGSGPAERARAEQIATALRAGRPPVAAGAPTVPVPDTPLPQAKLEQYLGKTVAAAAMRLSEGSVSEPIPAAGGLHVLQILGVEPGGVPPLAEIREAVAGEYRRRRGEEALRAYLADLRAQSTIERAKVE
jgi:parvulin-like peptidyl-prolyl isomerase